MEIKVIKSELTSIKTDCVLIYSFEDSERLYDGIVEVDKAIGGYITNLITSGGIKGTVDEIVVIHTLGKIVPDRIAVVGLGKKKEFNLERLRQAAGNASRHLRMMGVTKIASILCQAGSDFGMEKATQAEVEGCILGLYEFRQHITKDREYTGIKEYLIIEPDEMNTKEMVTGLNKALIIAGAVKLERDMVNQPGNFMTPSDMADIAQKIAEECGLKCTILDRDTMKELGMGALLGVAQGSIQPPRFIILQYKGGGSKNIGLVGKGITFDSGGISIKPSDSMGEMKTDMAGGASVIAAMYAIAMLKPEVNVTGLIPATENMPAGSSFKPGDILKAMNGKTIEIDSTDAEGRLILADALSYAGKQGLSPIVDVATLTGAIMRTFGDITTGVMGNNQEVINRIIKAGGEAGEKMWQLPLFPEYKELNKSDVADIKNSGGQRGGSITAAFFLSEFVGDIPWAHLDIAGTVRSDKNKGYMVKGASGVPVRTLINFVLSLAE